MRARYVYPKGHDRSANPSNYLNPRCLIVKITDKKLLKHSFSVTKITQF